MKETKFKKTETGAIPERWDIKKVMDVAVINAKSVDRSYPYSEISYLDVASIEKGQILESQELDLKDAPSRARRIVKKSDILISTVRPNLRHYAMLKNPQENAVASTGFAVITAKEIEPGFLYYSLTTDKYTEFLTAIAESHTSTYPSFNPDVIENSLIAVPPRDEQKAIAKILGDLDEKIEINNRTNKILEAMGQALFKRWFIDFEFPNEKALPYKSSGGKMIHSSLGPIPDGWEIAHIGDMVEIVGGTTPSTVEPSYWGGDINFATPKDMSSLTAPILLDTERKITEAGLECIGSRLLPIGTVLLSSRAPIGYLAIAGVPVAINQGFIAIKCSERLPNDYVLYWTKANMATIIGKANGTTFLEISKTNFKPIPLVVPLPNILEKFIVKAHLSYQKIANNLRETSFLVSIRDSLLPKLMSGEMRIN